MNKSRLIVVYILNLLGMMSQKWSTDLIPCSLPLYLRLWLTESCLPFFFLAFAFRSTFPLGFFFWLRLISLSWAVHFLATLLFLRVQSVWLNVVFIIGKSCMKLVTTIGMISCLTSPINEYQRPFRICFHLLTSPVVSHSGFIQSEHNNPLSCWKKSKSWQVKA